MNYRPESVQEARTDAGLTQQALADVVKVDLRTVQGYESRDKPRKPDADTIGRIATATGKPLSFFYGGANPCETAGSASADPAGAAKPLEPHAGAAYDGGTDEDEAPHRDPFLATKHGGRVSYPLAPLGHGNGPGPDNGALDAEAPRRIEYDEAVIRNELGRVPRRGFWTRAIGSSNEPSIHDGQYVFCEAVDRYLGPDRYILRVEDDGEDLIKRVERDGARRLVIKCDNAAYRDIVLEHKADDVYRDLDTGEAVRISFRGRVLIPNDRDTAQQFRFAALQGVTFAAVIGHLAQQIGQRAA